MYIYYGVIVNDLKDLITEYYSRVSAEAARRGEPDEWPPLSGPLDLESDFGALFECHQPRKELDWYYYIAVDCDYPSRDTDYEELDRRFHTACQDLFDNCYGLTFEVPKPDFIYFKS